MNTEPFVIERTYEAPAGKVWKAITDKDQMKQWYFDLSAFKPEVDFEFSFEGKTREGKSILHLCKVTEVIPQQKLAYSWQYENQPGYSVVTFELFPEGKQTRLRLTHAGLESFPQDDKSFQKQSFAEGWTYITGTSLKNFLEKE